MAHRRGLPLTGYRLSLRWQILLSLLLLMLATVVLVSVAVVSFTQQALVRQALDTTERLTLLAATTMSSALEPAEPLQSPMNSASLQRVAELFTAQRGGTQVAVWDTASNRVAAWPSTGAEVAADPAVGEAMRSGEVIARVVSHGSDREVTVRAPMRLDARIVGVVEVKVPLREVEAVAEQGGRVVVLYVVIDALAILLVGYWLLTRLIVTPLTQFASATERVARGDLTASLEIEGGREIVRLSEHFNRMVDALRNGRDLLQVRLEELAAANAQLGDANARLATAQQELVRSERLATVGTLSAGIAHEVGNPLSAVIGLVDLLEDATLMTPDERTDAVARVQRELRRIDGIIRELLSYARSDDGADEAVDVREPIETAVRLCQHHRRGRAVQVGVEAVEVAAARAHGGRLVQVLLNLLLNAADASPPGGTVTVRARSDGEWVRIEVGDQGGGIPAEVLPRIFDPFFTTKPPGEGTGLGLAIVERLVVAWGGRVEVHNEPGQGATFAVLLRRSVS